MRMSDHKNRRWFQFSLRTAIVATLVAAVGIGIYIRWPYYLAATALDNASGDKSFPAWPVVRAALIYNEAFRADSYEDMATLSAVCGETKIRTESR